MVNIVKKNFSRGAWRLVDKNGLDIYAPPRKIETKNGVVVFSGPICGDTKADCINSALELLGSILDGSVKLKPETAA